MNREELHSLFYSNVIARLKGVIDEDGYPVQLFGDNRSYMLFQSRPDNFRHNYLRERFLENRDVYIAFTLNGTAIHVLTEKVATGEVIVFRENLYRIFPDNGELALEVLKELLDKFFTVRTRARSTVVRYDSNQSGRTASHGRFTKVQ